MGLFRSKEKNPLEKIAGDRNSIIKSLQKIIRSASKFIEREKGVDTDQGARDLEIELEELEERTDKIRQELKQFEAEIVDAEEKSGKVRKKMKETGLSKDRIDSLRSRVREIEKEMEELREADRAGKLGNPIRAFDKEMEGKWAPEIEEIEEELSIQS